MNMPRLNKLLENDRFVLVLSLVIAVLLWVIVALVGGDEKPMDFSGVPIQLDEQILGDLGLSAFPEGAMTATVTVKGPYAEVGQLGADSFNIVARIPTGATEPNVYELAVYNANTAAVNYEVVSIMPSSVRVRLDRPESVSLPVTANIPALSYEPGYSSEYEVMRPASVTVTGTKLELDKIDRVEVLVELSEPLTRTHQADYPVRLLDVQGNEINLEDSHLSLDYAEVQVTIPVLLTKEIKLVQNFTNVPPGFPLDDLKDWMQMSNDVIEVAGPWDAMDAYSEYLLEPIDLRKVKLDNSSFYTNITLPSEQYRNISNVKTVTTWFTINSSSDDWKAATFTLTADNFEEINKPWNYNVSIQDRAIEVVFVGIDDIIDSMSDEDVFAELDYSVREITNGQYTYPVRLSAPGKGLVWATDLGKTSVLIEATEITSESEAD